jgi:DNA-binding transcriptional regulator YiaG
MPNFLFTAYSKNTRENITSSEKNALKLVITSIIKAYGEGIMIKLGESILRGAMDALDYAQGKQHGSKAHEVLVPSKIDVSAIRKKMHMSRQKFAMNLDLVFALLKNGREGSVCQNRQLELFNGYC